MGRFSAGFGCFRPFSADFQKFWSKTAKISAPPRAVDWCVVRARGSVAGSQVTRLCAEGAVKDQKNPERQKLTN